MALYHLCWGRLRNRQMISSGIYVNITRFFLYKFYFHNKFRFCIGKHALCDSRRKEFGIYLILQCVTPFPNVFPFDIVNYLVTLLKVIKSWWSEVTRYDCRVSTCRWTTIWVIWCWREKRSVNLTMWKTVTYVEFRGVSKSKQICSACLRVWKS